MGVSRHHWNKQTETSLLRLQWHTEAAAAAAVVVIKLKSRMLHTLNCVWKKERGEKIAAPCAHQLSSALHLIKCQTSDRIKSKGLNSPAGFLLTWWIFITVCLMPVSPIFHSIKDCCSRQRLPIFLVKYRDLGCEMALCSADSLPFSEGVIFSSLIILNDWSLRCFGKQGKQGDFDLILIAVKRWKGCNIYKGQVAAQVAIL